MTSSLLPTATRTTDHAVPTSAGHLTLDRGIATAPSAPGAPPPTASSRKKLKSSKTKPGKQLLSASSSTSSLRGYIMSDSDLDKKRNKLGYQRISIACAHCRRRKIRCLLSDDENEQRCQNCIRLKKECVFYPVDQQAAIDAHSEASSKSGAPPSAPSSAVSTSPPQQGSHAFDQQTHPFGSGFQNMPSEGPSGFQGIPIPPGGMQMQGAYPSQNYPYPPQGQPTQAWAAHDYSMHGPQIPMSAAPLLQQPRPRYNNNNNAVGADVAPFPPSEQQSPSVPPTDSMTFIPEHAHQSWQQQAQPLRSISYSNHYDPSFVQQPYLRHPAYSGQPDSRMLQNMSSQSPMPAHPHYMVPVEHRSSSVPGISPYQQPGQQMPQNWYPTTSSQGGYPNRPG